MRASARCGGLRGAARACVSARELVLRRGHGCEFCGWQTRTRATWGSAAPGTCPLDSIRSNRSPGCPLPGPHPNSPLVGRGSRGVRVRVTDLGESVGEFPARDCQSARDSWCEYERPYGYLAVLGPTRRCPCVIAKVGEQLWP